jgi:flagellar biosynthetic protein FlhB
MAERDDDQERSLPASERRLEQAREEGQVARSRELPAFLLVLLGAGVLWGAGDLMVGGFAQFLRAGLEFGAADAFDRGRVAARLGDAALQGLLLVAPFLAATLVVAFAAPVAVGGWAFSTQAFAPDAARLDPLKGIGRMFSLHGAGELGKALAKAGLVGSVAGVLLWSQRADFAALLAQSFQGAVFGTLALLGRDALLCALAFGLVAAADVPFTLWQHRRNLRMTPQEVRREQKETDGDPQLKGRIRSLQREAARRRMMQEVPKANVVVTNPSHYAVALAYHEGKMRAPRVVAKGRALVALRIREIAAAHRVPLLEAPALARALDRHVELGGDVPQALYRAVAQVLAYVYQLRAARAAGARLPLPPVALEVPPGMDPGLARA